jgi:hypothetical protein
MGSAGASGQARPRIFLAGALPYNVAADMMPGGDSQPISVRSAPFDNRSSGASGRLHLSFSLGDKRIRYAYIRKNGCSAFKAALGFDPSTSISRIKWRHPCLPFRHYDATIFVWRDPEERLVSLYRDKIIASSNSDEIIVRYRKAMGEEPSTFEKFVRFATLDADPHCWSQASHLKPVRYTHAIPLTGLYRTMSDIVGEDASQPFREPVNASKHISVEVTEEARRMIRTHYAADYHLIGALDSNEASRITAP